ncbi:MAG: hypothetical protein R3E39_03940 [Anaerolineae bacterium]
MTEIEYVSEFSASRELSFRQRWNDYLAIIFGLLILLAGINLRNQVLGATTAYSNPEAGINLRYPSNWLIDNNRNYVFRVRDIHETGFKTTIQIATMPLGRETSLRNVIDTLTLDRSQTLAVFNVIEIDNESPTSEGATSTSVTYTYVAVDPNPFLKSFPTVVTGTDVITIKRGQAVVVSFVADSKKFQDKSPIFEQFLYDLDF